ncbi:hypothetical protein FACS1894192_12440 [Bacilli bacterium]|nr:hypothetical protein FACS1894192_12440 [Bacilli bacterium]
MVYKDRAKAKLASQNEFASDVSFEDADVVIWYIVKDGVVINLAEHPEFKDLYKYLQKKGDKLKKDQYKTVSYNQAEKMTVDSMNGVEGRIARFEYYFRPAESAIAGVVAGVTTAKAIKATGKVPYGDMDRVTKKKNPDYSKLKSTNNFKDNTANHILGGEVNKKGKAVGYHTENNLHDDLDVKLSNVTAPDEFDVYKANVTINGTTKNSYSTFFPKEWSNQKIIDEINYAYGNMELSKRPGVYKGTASNGMEIEIQIKNGKIDSAYPFDKNPGLK